MLQPHFCCKQSIPPPPVSLLFRASVSFLSHLPWKIDSLCRAKEAVQNQDQKEMGVILPFASRVRSQLHLGPKAGDRTTEVTSKRLKKWGLNGKSLQGPAHMIILSSFVNGLS